ncbi:MAG: CRISPR-associated protein Csx14 [Thermoplasmata archaeon]|jgi:CRISPR-associated protein Csx14
MKSCLINPMGTSPMVASEMVDFFKSDYDKSLKDVIMIVTSDERIISGSYMAGSAIRVRFSDVHTHYVMLSSSDIMDEKNLYEFVDKIGGIIKNEKEKYGIDKIYANISGGRKIESIIISNFSQLLGIDEVWIVINKNIANYNIEFERILNELENFKEGENLEYYKKNQDKFDPIFYPKRSELSFFEIPSIRLSVEDLKILKELLKGKDLEIMNIPDYKVDAFIKSKLLANNKKRSIPTELGEIIFKYIT